MEIRMQASFARDIKKIAQPGLAREVRDIIAEIQAADKLADIKNVRKLQGAKNAYRIKLVANPSYRIGFHLAKNIVYLAVFAARKDIYKDFP